ncbi:transposase-like protein [Rhizobium sp. SG741]|nr:transposase-like protein [Rhizobium sp. SG741]
MIKLLKAQGIKPGVMITDKLRYYDAAKREIIPSRPGMKSLVSMSRKK